MCRSAMIPVFKRDQPCLYATILQDDISDVGFMIARFEGGEQVLASRSVRVARVEPPATSIRSFLYPIRPGEPYAHQDGFEPDLEESLIRALSETGGNVVEVLRRLIEMQGALTPEDIGGPTDIIKIDRSGARWVQVKSECRF